MKRLGNWDWIRNGASFLGTFAIGTVAFFVWNTNTEIPAGALNPLNETKEIRDIRETAAVLENHLESVSERLRMKHFLVEEVLQKRVDWQIALGTYSWLCAQSKVKAMDLKLAPESTEGIEKLVNSFTEWAFVASETETEERKCRLWSSWEVAGANIRRIEPTMPIEFLTRFQESEKMGLD